jgi:hypothetical protein
MRKSSSPYVLAVAALVASAGLLAIGGTAHASHHQVKISEVFTGNADPDVEFVELQMYADGENQFQPNGAEIDFYNADGTVAGSVTFGANPIDGNQRKVLAISADADPVFTTPTPDLLFANGDLLEPAGGAVCFVSNVYNVLPFIDCVSYGTFNNGPPNSANLPVGTNAPAPTTTQSIHRTIQPGCPTQLEAADDTGDSLADFALGAPNPSPSGVFPGLPACTPPGGGGNPPPTVSTAGPTGQRAAALKRCAKIKSKAKKKKCKKKARALPV